MTRAYNRIFWGCFSGWLVTVVVLSAVADGFGFTPFGSSITVIFWFGIGSLLYSRKCPHEERRFYRWASGVTLGLSLGVGAGFLVGGVFMWVAFGISVVFIAVTKYLMRDLFR